MAKKYKFDERYASELERLKNCINNASCMAKDISFYQREFTYDDKKFRKILGSDYEKIVDKIDSIEKMYTPAIYEKQRYRWMHDYVYNSLKKNKEIKYVPLLEIICKEQFCFIFDKPKENYVCKMIDIWRAQAEQEGKMHRTQSMPILLEKDKSISKKNKEECLGEIKKIVKRKMDFSGDEIRKTEKDIELCFDFLYYKVFPEVDFWKIYYADEEKIYLNWKCSLINAWLNDENRFFDSNNLQKMDELRTLIAGNPKRIDIVWTYSETDFNFFQNNFRRYEFDRCFYLLYLDIFGKEELEKASLSSLQSNQYENYYSWDYRIAITIHKIFQKWICPVNYQNISYSVLKEILIIILKDFRKPKKECGRIKLSEKGEVLFCTSNNTYEEKLWCTDISDSVLKTYFDPVYEIRISTGKYRYLSNVMAGEKVRSRSFEKLISDLGDLEEDLPFFERYMIESKTGIYAAWELYNIFYEVLSLASKTEDEEIYKNLKEQIKKLTKTIKRIPNLEFKMWFIHQLGEIISDIMKDDSCNIYDAIEIIIECLETELSEFQEKYNTMFFALLYLFKNESNWKNMMWIKNFKTEEVISEMEQFKSLKNNMDMQSYTHMKFNALYSAESKREPYKWFRDIWKSLITNFD